MKFLTLALAVTAIACNLVFATPAEARHHHGCHRRNWNNGTCNNGNWNNGNWNNGWGLGRQRNQYNRFWRNRGYGGYRTSGLLGNMFRYY